MNEEVKVGSLWQAKCRAQGFNGAWVAFYPPKIRFQANHMAPQYESIELDIGDWLIVTEHVNQFVKPNLK